jgi:glucosamine-6-phosphate deaminase
MMTTPWLEKTSVSPTVEALAKTAAEYAATRMRDLLKQQQTLRLVAATGASQLKFLAELTAAEGIDWKRVELFHLDEYIGVGRDHPASFAGYIEERIVRKAGIPVFHLLDGLRDPHAVIAEASELIRQKPVDLAFVGIGENAHLAFNDPPADFAVEDPYLIVELDEACRRQQVGEGWFPTFNDVPKQAISMSVKQIMSSRSIICVVPDERKAEAVRASLLGDVTPQVPASILQQHPDVRFFLDNASAKFLTANEVLD